MDSEQVGKAGFVKESLTQPWESNPGPSPIRTYHNSVCWFKTLQELRMLSSVNLNCQGRYVGII